MNSQYTLGECCEFFSGTGFPVQYQGQVTGKYAFYKVGDISRNVQKGNMFLSECENYVDTETVKAIKGTVLPAGTVVFAKIGEAVKLNRRAITQAECLVDNNVMGIRPLPKYLDMSYFFFFMQNLKMERFAEATTVPSVKKSVLEKISIECPPLHIQQQIAHLFSHLDALIQEYRDMLCFFDQLVKSRFIEMFGEPRANPKGLPIHQLGDHVLFLTSGSRGWSQYFTDEGEYFITIKNVKDCHISLENVQYVLPPNNAEANRTRVEEGDLLISITADLGRTGVVSKEIATHGAYINQHLTCIRLDRQVLHPLYTAYYLESAAGKEQFDAKNQNGVKAGLNFNAINSLQLLIPSMSEQKDFVVFVEQTDKSKFSLKNGGKEAHFAVKCIWESLCRGTLT